MVVTSYSRPRLTIELQPIEVIWGNNNQGKTTAADLKKMLDYFFVRITRDMFISVWIKLIETGLRYITSEQPRILSI